MDTAQLIARQKRYGVKQHAGFNEQTAQKIGAELERLGEGKPAQGVSPEEFVAAAARGEAPVCASRLTWDDEVAGHNWRLQEARLTLNHITIIESDEEGHETELRAFHAVRIEVGNGEPHQERRYVPLSVVREEQDLVEQVIAEAQGEFIRAKEKLGLYEDHVRATHPSVARVMDVVKDELQAEAEPEEEPESTVNGKRGSKGG